MISTKEGGGNKPQLYDVNNGEYTDQQKKELFEIEMSNIVLKYVLNCKDTFEPRFPIYGFHNEDYCNLYVKFCIKNPKININISKIKNYLLVFKTKSDKSHIFTTNGYTNSESELLKNNIIEGLDIKRIKYNSLSEYCLKVEIHSSVKSLNTNKKIEIKTIWKYDESINTISFITAFPDKNKEE